VISDWWGFSKFRYFATSLFIYDEPSLYNILRVLHDEFFGPVEGVVVPNVKRQTSNAKRQTPGVECQVSIAKRQTSSVKRQMGGGYG
jgi:hypothetical protein